jgi:hypothetical protein
VNVPEQGTTPLLELKCSQGGLVMVQAQLLPLGVTRKTPLAPPAAYDSELSAKA